MTPPEAAEPPRFLVVFALEGEARPFRRQLAGRPGVEVAVTGMGPENARRGFLTALERGRPGVVITSGLAGGLDPGLALNDIVCECGSDFPLRQLLLDRGARPVRFHCAPQVICFAADKRRLFQSGGAEAVEMESGVIRALCRDQGIPAATVRVISDTAGEDLPLDFNRYARPNHQIAYEKIVLALLARPGKLPELLRFQRQTQAAAAQLARFLVQVAAG